MEVRNINKAFGGLNVLSDISFDVRNGEITSVIGRSGCGKTTLLKIIADLIPQDAGRIILGKGETGMNPKISFVFQDPALAPWRTSYQNVALPLEVIKTPKRTREAMIGRTIDMVGLSGFEDYLPAQLSGGMQQRVAIARALVTEPDILLMDEPFSKLDEFTRKLLNSKMLEIWGKLRFTILFITHSIEEAAFLSRRVVVLTGKPATIKEIFRVQFPYPRDTDIKFDQIFVQLTKKIETCLCFN